MVILVPVPQGCAQMLATSWLKFTQTARSSIALCRSVPDWRLSFLLTCCPFIPVLITLARYPSSTPHHDNNKVKITSDE